MKYLSLTLFALFFYCLSGKCQNAKPYSFSLSAGFLYNNHYEDLLFRPTLCATNCAIQSQKSKHGLIIEAQFYWHLAERHYLSLGYALLERGVHETLIDDIGQTSHIEAQWDYNALQAAYRLDMIARDKFRLYIQNGVAMEFLMGEPDFGNILAQQSWSIYTELGTEFQLAPNASVLLVPQFRTNLKSYSTRKYNAFSSEYRPYSISGRLGVRFGL